LTSTSLILSNILITYITMHEAQLERIVKKAVQKERRLWVSLFAFAFVFTLYRTPVQVVDSNVGLQNTNTLPVNRRMLQASSAPGKGKIAAAAPATEISELAIPSAEPAAEDLISQDFLAFTPSPEAESSDLAAVAAVAPATEISELAIPSAEPAAEDLISQDFLASTPSPEAESLDFALAPAIEAPLPLRRNSSATVVEKCHCPPGLQGPKVKICIYSLGHR
jgi:hypothetical protein